MTRALKRDFILNWRFFGMPPSIITIQAQVYNILKQNICDGVYKPGQRLLETEVAASLKVSRSPVREAMRKLATEGLVKEFPNRGVFVRQFSDEDIDHIFEVRILNVKLAPEARLAGNRQF